VRKFLAQFKGVGLEIAMEATTGWRFVVDELERIAAKVHLESRQRPAGGRARAARERRLG
jgi:hypothetical protein